ncbi:MAG: zincin-like metallopeptidase toxin domain-containing protein [Marinilabilia sp.]
MTFTGRNIKVNVEGNKRPKTSDRIIIADDANIIRSAFSHEGQHYEDYKTLGREAYLDLSKSQREGRAYNTQMSDLLGKKFLRD